MEEYEIYNRFLVHHYPVTQALHIQTNICMQNFMVFVYLDLQLHFPMRPTYLQGHLDRGKFFQSDSEKIPNSHEVSHEQESVDLLHGPHSLVPSQPKLLVT